MQFKRVLCSVLRVRTCSIKKKLNVTASPVMAALIVQKKEEKNP